MARHANPESTPKPCTLEGIKRIGEIHVYVARCFGNCTVALRPGVAGGNLAATLKSLNGRLMPLRDSYKIPVGFPNRLCLAAARLARGGRDKEEDHYSTDAEFTAWTPHDFDHYVCPSGWALDNRPSCAHHIETWKVNSINKSRIFAGVYEAEWLQERVGAVEYIRNLHLETPRKYTLSIVSRSWGTRVYRRGQELREMRNVLRLYAKAERPTFEQLNDIGMTVVTSANLTSPQRSETFDLPDPLGFVVSEIVRKMTADKELNDWNSYHTSVSRNPNPRLGGGVLDLPPPPSVIGRKENIRIYGPQECGGCKNAMGV